MGFGALFTNPAHRGDDPSEDKLLSELTTWAISA